MLRISKSKYVEYCQCEKMLWLEKYHPELKEISPDTLEIFAVGNEVGDLAMQLFGEYQDVTTFKEDNSLDLEQMTIKTKELLDQGFETICEASFIDEGLYCAVDILRKNNDSYDIYEVKTSTKVKDVHLIDVSYQRYLLEKCGLKINKCYVVTINNTYYRHGALDIKQLFKINEVTFDIEKYYLEVANNLKAAETVVSSDLEPSTLLGPQCAKPYLCAFRSHCFKDLPSPNVTDLYSRSDSYYLLGQGIVSFADLKAISLTKVQTLQVNSYLKNQDLYLESENLEKFLSTIKYPVYYLDIKTMFPLLPPYDNTKPFMQIPYQYSLHYQLTPSSEVVHKTFLADISVDPRYSFAKSLITDINQLGTVVVFNKDYKDLRIKELAALFPEFGLELNNIAQHFVDLSLAFTKGFIYKKSLNGIFMLPNVISSLLDDDESSMIDGINKGEQYRKEFLKANKLSQSELKKVRKNLLAYSHLETFAIIKIHQKLKKLINLL